MEYQVLPGLKSPIKELDHKGFAILTHVYGTKETDLIKTKIEAYHKANLDEERYAIRALLEKIPSLKKLLINTNLVTILGRINPSLFLTKAIYFDKSPEANWYVTWHQDIVINVKEKIETEGFSGWTKKSGVYGVCPPEQILKDTITIRIHLDDTDEQNGALKVIPGSHNQIFNNHDIQSITQNSISINCNVGACGIHIMKPLLLHASSKATSPRHRRVVHLEFNATKLPNKLLWAERLTIK